MFTAYRPIRPLAACLLASAAIAATAAAPAAAADPQVQRAQATEQYLQSFGGPASEAQRAEATEQYLQSYGAPKPIAPSVPTGETPWLPIVLAGAFVVIGLGAVQMRRVHVRRRTGVPLAT